MSLVRRSPCLVCLVLLLPLGLPACGNQRDPRGVDQNDDLLADDLGKFVDLDGDGAADDIDIDGDGKVDGPGADTDGDGKADALALDTDCDGLFDSLDTSGDGRADWVTRLKPPRENVEGCKPPALGGGGGDGAYGGAGSQGGAAGVAGAGAGGTPNSGASGRGGTAAGTGAGGKAAGGAGLGGASHTGGGGSGTLSQLGKGVFQGTGSSTERYAEGDVYRDGVGYKFMANGWGDGWQGHDVSWNGTSFTLAALTGSQSANYAPAGYPTVFCGLYSEPPKRSPGQCGLPMAINAAKSIKTGWRWASNGSAGQYNAAWDIWLGNGESLESYLMVWLRDPPGQQPAGAAAVSGAAVPGLPGSWNIWIGSVNGHPIVNYVKAEGADLAELELDVMDVYADAKRRNYQLPGTHVIAVAVGFEVWNGPIANLDSDDFYVTVE